MRLSSSQVAVALLLGALFSLAIWVAVPFNNYLLNNSFIADGYLPEVVLFFLLILILIANPILLRFCSRFALTYRQLALVVSVMLFAAVLPSNGLLGMFPYSLAQATQEANESPALSDVHRRMNMPAVLFPDTLGYEVETPASDQLLDELLPGASIPWRNWLGPLLSWGALITAGWLMMLGMGMIVYPQWRDNERLPFPLLVVYDSLVASPEKGRLLPPLFRNKLFWSGCLAVMLIHAFNGLNHHTGGMFPSFPLAWNLRAAFSDGIWRYAGAPFAYSRIYFILVGMAYFIPNRYSFSIWFTYIAYGFYEMVAISYFPPFDGDTLYNHGLGSVLVIACSALWLGRRHWAKVFRSTFSRPSDEEGKRNATAGRMFVAGIVGMWVFFAWAGVPLVWCFPLVLIIFVVMLVIARCIAETGLTYLWIIPLMSWIRLVPATWLDPVLIYMSGIMLMLANRASAVSVTVMATLAMGMDKYASPRYQRRLGYAAITVLVVGLVVCGAVHLYMGYNFSSSLDGALRPIVGHRASRMDNAISLLKAWGRGAPWAADSGRWKHIAFGVSLASALQWACIAIPKWPIHPIGMIFPASSIGWRTCAPLMLGWFIKMILLKYGGAHVFRKAKPLFIGLILGEVFSVIVWTLVPIILVLLGADPREVGHITIFQYT